MAVIRYRLQYSAVDADLIGALNPSLFITEGAPIAGTPAISDAEMAQLKTGGTEVIGYVNVSVTDDGRPYWDAGWTVDGSDTGATTGAAPAWLAGQPTNPFGYVVDFTDAAWQQIVIDQAVDLVTRGYDGVFLDDVAQYFVSGATGLSGIPAQAEAMMDFVADIASAIRAVDAGAKVIVNATPYIVTDAPGGAGSAASVAFLDAVDAMLIESFFGINRTRETAAITQARNAILPHMDVLALEYGGTLTEIAGFARSAIENGFAAFASLDAGYDTAGRAVIQGGAGNNRISGGAGQDLIFGLAGQDRLAGAAGIDWLEGGTGADRLTGGSGGDRFAFLGHNFGRDVIADYGRGDRIVLDGPASSFADVDIRRDGNDSVIELLAGGSGEIRLTGIRPATLDADDFLFL